MGVVQEREIPAIDDAFARGLGNFESLEKLKENLRDGLLEEKMMKSKDDRRTKILDALVEKSAIEYPLMLVEEELKRMMREFEMQIRPMGLDFAEYLVQMKKTAEELKKEWEPQAKKRLAAHMILDALAKEEEIDIDSQEVEAEMNKTLAQYKDVKDIGKQIDMERLYAAARGQLLNEKTFVWLESL
jgi:trigger factor